MHLAAASHSSTQSEVISLDAGLRMDGIHALGLSDTVIEVLRSSPAPSPSIRSGRPAVMPSQCEKDPQVRTKSKHPMWEEIKLEDIDHVDPNSQFSHHRDLLYVFGV